MYLLFNILFVVVGVYPVFISYIWTYQLCTVLDFYVFIERKFDNISYACILNIQLRTLED